MDTSDKEYVVLLREVFDSCDISKNGQLDRNELRELCQKLQLEKQTDVLVEDLIRHSQSGRVGFEDFKEGFVNVLSTAADTLQSSSGEEEVIPKYVKDGKKYGRRSRPDFPTDTETTDYSDNDFSFGSPTYWGTRQTPSRERLSSISSHESERSTGSKEKDKAETFEAEGQMNQSMANVENVLDPVSGEQRLRDVWKELGVGQTGYLTVEELSSVCEHIGMAENLTGEDLQGMFDKLDADRDGFVSFDEFVHGLFQHGPNVPSTPIRPPSSVRKEKLRIAMSLNLNDNRNQTPSITLANSGAGIFTQLDSGNTGYAKPEEIIEFWGGLNVNNGSDILRHLEFDPNTKVNLQELSHALEQEMMSLEEDNAVYQAAVVTCHQEVKHLKSGMDQLAGEADKLKTDLNESNLRNSMLVQETDDRHVATEKAWETKLQKLEKKYREQIKSLQNEGDEERELLTNQASRQKHKLEATFVTLKDEEMRLKEKVVDQLKEIERYEKELQEMTERLSEFEKVNFRLQREVESAEDLRRQLADTESDRALMNDEQQKFTQQKLNLLEAENKELRDKNDELTMEVESLKQQVASQKRKYRERRTSDLRLQRTGSRLSDYAKPTVAKKLGSSSDNSEEEGSPSRIRRRLPTKPKPDRSDDEEKQATIDKIKAEFESELHSLRATLEDERTDRRAEVTRLEERHVRMLQQAEDDTRRDTEKLERRFENERREMEIQFSEDKMKLAERLKRDFDDDLEIRTQTMKSTLQQEKNRLEHTLSRDRNDLDTLLRQKTEAELKLKLQQEELDVEFSREKRKLKEQLELEKRDLEDTHRQDIYDYENMFVKGESALRGKLRQDFYDLLDRHKQEVTDRTRRDLLEQYDEEKQVLQEAYNIERAELSATYTGDRQEIEDEYRRQLDELEDQFQLEREAIEQEVADRIREDMEDDFMTQVERIKGAFHEERQQLEDMNDMLSRELEEKGQLLDQSAGSSRKEEEYRRKLDGLKRINSDLNRDKSKTEDKVADLREQLLSLQQEYNNLKQALEMQITELAIQKEEIVVQSHQQQGLTADSSTDKILIENLEKENLELQTSLKNLENSLNNSQSKAKDISTLQVHVDNWEREKRSLQGQLRETKGQLLAANTSRSILASQHVRDLQAAKDEKGVDINTYNNVLTRLHESEVKVGKLEEALDVRSTEMSQVLTESLADYLKKLSGLVEERDVTGKKLKRTQDMLGEQVNNLRNQLQKNTKTSVLVKDLYVENARLVSALQAVEEKRKDVQTNNYKLQGKYDTLMTMFKKISKAALAHV